MRKFVYFVAMIPFVVWAGSWDGRVRVDNDAVAKLLGKEAITSAQCLAITFADGETVRSSTFCQGTWGKVFTDTTAKVTFDTCNMDNVDLSGMPNVVLVNCTHRRFADFNGKDRLQNLDGTWQNTYTDGMAVE